TRFSRDWSSDVCSSDLSVFGVKVRKINRIEEIATVLSLFGDQAGDTLGPDFLKRHIHYQLQNQSIARLENLVGFHHAAIAVQLVHAGLDGFFTKQSLANTEAGNQIR